ncbi:hypothetical protein ZEAMMB73_Zm00001d037002 [Zea mays]|uniref:Uncharacterized protein n=1 Tax=Zea mays TaxID=4577 RepID=A0A1D6LT84_MAIZE|nr:hypothetical protein ZEAMMB73_Zm00001d037002 [Zea mays]AQK82627.1 hypothetical protein ZEAMMB73_Zm00001d037002 [Zea mays]
MAEHKSSSSVACCTSVELPTLAATPSPSPPWIWPSLHLSFQPWTATSPAYSSSLSMSCFGHRVFDENPKSMDSTYTTQIRSARLFDVYFTHLI